MIKTDKNYILLMVRENEIYHMEHSSDYAKLLNAAIELALHHLEKEGRENLEYWNTSLNQLLAQWETRDHESGDKYGDVSVSYFADTRDFSFWSRIDDTIDIYIKPLD